MSFLRAVTLPADRVRDPEAFPFSLPAVRALTGGVDLDPGITILVGENGSGKSTVLEAIAVAAGLNAEGGSNNMTFSTNATHSELHEALRLTRTGKRPRTQFFLRAESFYNVATEVDRLDAGDVGSGAPLLGAYGGRSLHEQSHGESFLSLVVNRFGPGGLYLLDEPEAAMSPQGLLGLMARLLDLVREGSQLVLATHSPFLLALPGAKVLELSADGIAEVSWEDTEHVRLTRAFLDGPERFLRHLV